MTTARSAPRPARAVSTSGERQRRRQERQRLLREELLAVAVLLAVLGVTLVLLGLQWLDAGSATSSSLAPAYSHLSSEVAHEAMRG